VSGVARALVRDVSDTARWVAHYRALESERPGGILQDPLARRLAGERGRAIARALPKLSLEWMIPVRAKIYDELLLETLAAGGDVAPEALVDEIDEGFTQPVARHGARPR
jgi:O-methyltransferase involved in polyketide biosynthesis